MGEKPEASLEELIEATRRRLAGLRLESPDLAKLLPPSNVPGASSAAPLESEPMVRPQRALLGAFLDKITLEIDGLRGDSGERARRPAPESPAPPPAPEPPPPARGERLALPRTAAHEPPSPPRPAALTPKPEAKPAPEPLGKPAPEPAALPKAPAEPPGPTRPPINLEELPRPSRPWVHGGPPSRGRSSADRLLQALRLLEIKRLAWAAAAGLIAWSLWLWRSAPPVSFPAALPLERTAGLALAGNSAFTADREKRRLHAVDLATLDVSVTEAFPNPSPAALAAAQGGLWSADDSAGKIYFHRPPSYVATRDYPAPGGRPAALHFDGRALWLFSAADRRLRRLKPGPGEKLDVQFDAALDLVQPMGLHRQAAFFYVFDAADLRLHRYRLSEQPDGSATSLTPDGSASVERRLRAAGVPTGFAGTEKAAWIVTERPAVLYRIPWTELEFR